MLHDDGLFLSVYLPTTRTWWHISVS